jgi:hypothetical protein
VAVVQAGDYVYGFSAQQGKWETQQIRPPMLGAPVLMDDWATVSTVGRIHAFSSRTGKWATLDVKAQMLRRPAEQ